MTDSFDLQVREKFALVEFEREQMHPYQDEAAQFATDHPFCMLMIDMGLGKTVSSLTVIADLLSAFLTEKVLVIGPLKVVTDTWPNEIAKWRHTAWMNYTLLRESDDDPRLAEARARARDFGRSEGLGPREVQALQNRAETKERERIRRELAKSPSSIHIINREGIEWLVNLHAAKWPYRFVIIDESSSFKDHESHRFKALAKVRNTPGLIKRLICLTATPAAETYEHLFAQFYLLDRGERLGKDIGWYRERYFTYNQWSRKYKLRPGAEEEILAKIADISLVMKSKDYLPRDEPTIIRRKVKLSPEQIKQIKDFEKHFVLTLTDGTEIEAKTAAMLASMQLQLASGAVYETKYVGDYETEDLKKVKKVHHVHDHKIDTLREIFEEAQTQGENILVAYYWQSSLARLKKAFPKAVVMDREAKHAKPWNAGKIPMLLIHPQSAGHGLNLQKGGHILVFFDLIYSLEFYLQTIGRIDRQGQTQPVIIELLVAEGTRDELVADSNIEKQDAQEKLFTILKRLIRKLRGKDELIE